MDRGCFLSALPREGGRGGQTRAVASGAARGGERRLPGLTEAGAAIFPGGAAALPRSRQPRVERLRLRLHPGRARAPVLPLLGCASGNRSAAAGGVSAAAALLLRCNEGFLREACVCVFLGFSYFAFFLKE